MDLIQAQQALDQARAQLTDLDGQLANDPENEGLKAQQAALQDRVGMLQTTVDALTSAQESAGKLNELESTVHEQTQTITRLSTTQATDTRRDQDINSSMPFGEELKEIQELAMTDPGEASRRLSELQPRIMRHTNETAVDSALNATKIYIDNRQAIDRVENDPKYAHLKPYSDTIRSRVVFLTERKGLSLQKALNMAVQEADALYQQGKKSVEPQHVPPAPGAVGGESGGHIPPTPPKKETEPSVKEEMRSRDDARFNKALGTRG